ncbi:MAG: ThuA domain-containing protein [Alphaproteobacteria bacterium]|nr:ThuA domain-containing protein [Alphaproteobacteria bacterium]
MARNLLLTGGIGHPFADAAPALATILDSAGIDSEITTDIEDGCARLPSGGFDLVTVYALRWRMLDNEKYAPHRAQWGFSLSSASRQALTDHVTKGGGLFAVHTAALCFDDWPEWRALAGGVWIWGQSFHPPRGDAAARVTDKPHPITSDVVPFDTVDEVYSNLSLAADVVPLMTARAGNGGPDAKDWPILWARQVGRGRAVYDALGHDRVALEQPTHQRILRRAALWALGRADAEISAA